MIATEPLTYTVGKECCQLDGMCLLKTCIQKCSEEKTAAWHVHRSEDLHACLSSMDAVIVIEYNQKFRVFL